MDAKEAIKALNAGITEAKEHYERRKDEDDITMIELFGVCVEALEKQVPQKPKEKPQGGIIKCPVCGEFINWYARFCWNCGQAIKNDKE